MQAPGPPSGTTCLVSSPDPRLGIFGTVQSPAPRVTAIPVGTLEYRSELWRKAAKHQGRTYGDRILAGVLRKPIDLNPLEIGGGS